MTVKIETHGYFTTGSTGENIRLSSSSSLPDRMCINVHILKQKRQ